MAQRTRNKFVARQRTVDAELAADNANGRGVLRIVKSGVATDVAYFDDTQFSPQVSALPAATVDLGSTANPYRNVYLSGLLNESAADALTAAGTTQAGALALTKEINRFTTVAASSGARLPTAAPGLTIVIINNGANSLQVYGAGTDIIDDVLTATGVAQMVGSTVIYACTVAGKWYTEGLGTGYSGSLQTISFADALTALGSTQADALALTKSINRITVGAATTGVGLPASAAGLQITIINAVANSIHVYPVIGGSETINGNAAATGVVQMSNSIVTYYCTVAGTWIALGLGSGFSAALPTNSFANALTAAGSGQADALALTAEINRVTTGASTTGVGLPASAPGMMITVVNSVANSIHVYPVIGGSETINGNAAATGIIIGPNTVLTFICTVAGTWVTGVSAMPQIQYQTASNTTSFTATGAQVAGNNENILNLTGALGSGQNIQLPTVAAMVAAMHNVYVGQSFRLRILNLSSGAFSWTVTTNTGWTLNGTMTIGQNFSKEFVVTLTSLSAATIQSVGQVAQSAV